MGHISINKGAQLGHLCMCRCVGVYKCLDRAGILRPSYLVYKCCAVYAFVAEIVSAAPKRSVLSLCDKMPGGERREGGWRKAS